MDQSKSDTTEALRRIATEWIEHGWQRGDPGIVDALHAPDFVDRDPGGRTPDNEGFKAGIVALYRAFSDLRARVEDLVVEVPRATAPRPDPETGPESNPPPQGGSAAVSGTVAVRWTASGTHTGPYLGAEPTGRRIAFKGIEIVRVRDGRIAERWGEWDGIDLLAQLGRVEL